MFPAPLPDLDGLDPETLKALLIAKHKQLSSNSEEIEHLKLVIEKYRRMIFGRKSEKLTRELQQLELRLENWRPRKLQTRRFKKTVKRRLCRTPIPGRDRRVQGASLCPKTCLVK